MTSSPTTALVEAATTRGWEGQPLTLYLKPDTYAFSEPHYMACWDEDGVPRSAIVGINGVPR